MTATYDLTTAIGQVRLLIGDTDVDNAVFTDEELQVFLTAQSNNVNLAAAMAADAWAAKYATSASQERIGDYSYSQSIVANLKSLAQALRDGDLGKPATAYTGIVEDLDATGEELE